MCLTEVVSKDFLGQAGSPEACDPGYCKRVWVWRPCSASPPQPWAMRKEGEPYTWTLSFYQSEDTMISDWKKSLGISPRLSDPAASLKSTLLLTALSGFSLHLE